MRGDDRPEAQKNTSDLVEVLKTSDSITKREVATVREMAALPVRDQTEFWEKNFRPLVVEEEALREKAMNLDAKRKALGY